MRRAFTLVELLIVIIVIAVLAAVAIPKFQNSSQRAQESAARADLKVLRQAIASFQMDTSLYPMSIDSLAATTAPAKGRRFNGNNWLSPALPNGWNGPYIYKAPVCPIDGYEYAFRFSSKGQLNVRISQSGDSDEDNNESGNPYFNW